MISTCEPYRQSEQKRCEKFCGPKEQKAPGLAKKGETGCFLGAGGDENGWGRVQPDEKTQCPNQSEHHSRATQAKRKPAKTQCFRRFLAGAEGLVSAAASGAAPRWGAPSTDRGGSQGRRGSATGTHCPFGTRFWSGCGNAPQGAGEGRCCPVPAASPRESGVILVLRAALAAVFQVFYTFSFL